MAGVGKNIIIRKDLIRIVGNELKRISEDKSLGIDYVTICACALEFLDEVLEENYDFPIDVDRIMKSVGVEVIYQPLDSDEDESMNRLHRVVGRTLKKVNRFTEETVEVVLIDDKSRRDEQRYAMAHELAHFLIHHSERQFVSEYCVMPMLFKKIEEMVADIFAIFILIPPPLFLKEFNTYIGVRPVPVMTSEWLKYLSIVAEVPYEEVAIGYQNIRYVCGIVYGIKFQEREITINEDENIKAILHGQIEKMKDAITPEIVDKLFR